MRLNNLRTLEEVVNSKFSGESPAESRMKILLAILTSSKPDLARLCYDSIISQQHNYLDTDIVVIVNSTNPHHLEDIRQVMPPNTTIQETESNGRPGKGHNSVLRYFQQHPEYDYVVMVDGDDFLYPRALSRLEHYLQYEPDILFIAFHDILQSEIPAKDSNIPFITFHNKCCLSYNVEAITLGEWHRVKGAINPFHGDINHMNTYARPFVFSQKSLEYDIFYRDPNSQILRNEMTEYYRDPNSQILRNEMTEYYRDSNSQILRNGMTEYYDENMTLYDDFIVFLKAFELSAIGKLKTYAAVDSNLYLYNATSLDAATKRYFSDENATIRKQENEYYQTSIKNRFLTLKRWELSKFPLLELGQNSDPDGFLSKCKFVDDLAAKMRLQCMVPQQDNIDLILRHCREVGNQIFHDDLIATLEWILPK